MEDWDKFSMEESFAINTPLPLSKTELLVSVMTIDNFSYRMKKIPQYQQTKLEDIYDGQITNEKMLWY